MTVLHQIRSALATTDPSRCVPAQYCNFSAALRSSHGDLRSSLSGPFQQPRAWHRSVGLATSPGHQKTPNPDVGSGHWRRPRWWCTGSRTVRRSAGRASARRRRPGMGLHPRIACCDLADGQCVLPAAADAGAGPAGRGLRACSCQCELVIAVVLLSSACGRPPIGRAAWTATPVCLPRLRRARACHDRSQDVVLTHLH